MADPLTIEEFSALLEEICVVSSLKNSIALALSGGPDSFALCKMMSEWADKQSGTDIHALIVDHDLRPESAGEAEDVLNRAAGLSCIKPVILKWEGAKPEASVQEEARNARYRLMAEYCKAQGIAHLFLAHHQDDQAETFLFRLCKGSGLDGLSAMKAVQKYSDDLTLIRPLLNIPKRRLVETCAHYDLPAVSDPSNENEDFARVRLRKSWVVLEEEGLSSKRLATTARRLGRAQSALDQIADDLFHHIAQIQDGRIALELSSFKEAHEEIALRVILKSIRILRQGEDYNPRMEKIEDLFADLWRDQPFRKRTLGGLVFSQDDKARKITIQREG